jgi:hypothetical protein
MTILGVDIEHPQHITRQRIAICYQRSCHKLPSNLANQKESQPAEKKQLLFQSASLRTTASGAGDFAFGPERIENCQF